MVSDKLLISRPLIAPAFAWLFVTALWHYRCCGAQLNWRAASSSHPRDDNGGYALFNRTEFQDHPRTLAQCQLRARVLLDSCMKGGMAVPGEARARDDLLDMRVLPVPSLDLVFRGLTSSMGA